MKKGNGKIIYWYNVKKGNKTMIESLIESFIPFINGETITKSRGFSNHSPALGNLATYSEAEKEAAETELEEVFRHNQCR